MVWHSHLFNNFPKFIVMHTAIGFSVVNETEVDVSLESVFIPIPKKGDAIEYLNYRTIVFNLHTSKVIFKILQARLQHYMNWELLDVQLGLERAEKPDIKLQNSLDHRESKGIPEKYEITVNN